LAAGSGDRGVADTRCDGRRRSDSLRNFAFQLHGSALERFNKSGSRDGKSVGGFREVLDGGGPLPFFTTAPAPQSGSGPPPSKTLARDSTA
jgi:hypothetical protein